MYFLTVIFHVVILSACVIPGAMAIPQESTGGSQTQLQDDLDFAVDLARYRYFDLANEYVERIKSSPMSENEKSTLHMTTASILQLAADYSTDQEERYTSFNRAIEEFKGFIEYNTYHPKYNEARIKLADVYQNLGRYLNDKRGRMTDDPEAAETLKKEADQAYKECVQLLNDVVKSLRESSDNNQSAGQVEQAEKDLTEAQQAEYSKGIAYYHWGLTFDEGEFNREDYLDRCIETLDEYIWDADDTNFNSLWAYVFQGRAYVEKGDLEDGLDLVKDLLNSERGGITVDHTDDVGPEYKHFVTDLIEAATRLTARIYYLLEDYDKADECVTILMKEFERKGFELSQVGNSARLFQARSIFDKGGPDNKARAAEICNDVSEHNPTNYIGYEARILLNEIINSSGGADIGVSPQVLMAAADGSKSQKNYFDAVLGYMKVLAACKTKQQTDEFESKTWLSIGQCYQLMKRHLEAAAAFEQGFLKADKNKNEITYESCALNWQNSLFIRQKNTKDPFDEKRNRTAIQVLVSKNIKKDLQLMLAKEAFAKAMSAQTIEVKKEEFTKALNEFRSIDIKSKLYSTALIYQGRCNYEMEEYGEAIKRLKYFEKYMQNMGPAKSREDKQDRKKAEAQGAYWLAESYSKEKKYSDAVKTLSGFESRFPSQVGFFAPVIYNRIQSRLGLKDFKNAETFYSTLKKKYPDSDLISISAFYISQAFIGNATSLKAKEGEESPKEYYDNLLKGVQYMDSHCEMDQYRSYSNLKNVCNWYKKIGEYNFKNDKNDKKLLELAIAKYGKLIEVFGNNEEYKSDIESSVNRNIAELLSTLHRFPEAKKYWIALVNKNKKNPSILRGTAFCMGGWVEWDGKTCIEISGTGDYTPALDANRDPRNKKVSLKSAYDIWNYLLRGISDRGEKQSDAWWEAKFYTAYCTYRAGEKNPEYNRYSSDIIKNLKLFYSDMGGPNWSPKFGYLERMLRRR